MKEGGHFMTSNNYQPKPEHKFTFGLWTVGNRGRDPFGDATRPSLPPIKIVKELSRLGAELGAHIYVFWGGREGAEVDAAKDPREALKWNREALNFLCEYSIDQGYDYKFALEAKPNEPRGDIYLPTTGAMLAFISTLDHPEIF